MPSRTPTINKLSQYKSIKCQKAKGILAAIIIGCAISHLTTSTLDFDNVKTLIIPRYFQSQNVKLDVEGKYLVFKTSNIITIPPADIIQIDAILDTHIDMIATMTQNDNLPVLVATDLYQDPTLHVFNMMLYNLETKPTIIHPNSLHFSNISFLLAIPIDREKVVQKARMHKKHHQLNLCGPSNQAYLQARPQKPSCYATGGIQRLCEPK